MKTTDPRDPLDHKIDALLASRPLKPSDDFAARVLTAAENHAANQHTATTHGSRALTGIVYFGLPLAAAVAVALVIVSVLKQDPAAPAKTAVATTLATNSTPTEPTAISEEQAQEIFLLEEGLSALAYADDNSSLGSDTLLQTLDALYFEI